MHLRWLASAILTLGVSLQVEAQVTPVTVPKGKLRWDFSGQFESWDWRWRDGSREEAAFDFTRLPLGSDFVPGLAETEARLKRLTGLSQLNLSLGQSIASEIVNRGTRSIGGAVGVTKSITLFGRVPFVSVKVEPRFVIDTTNSNVGASLGTQSSVYSAFLAAVATATSALQSRLAGGSYDAEPTLKALAESRVIYGTTLEAELRALLVDPASASAFLPVAGSAVGALLTAQILAFQTDLQILGVGGFTSALELPKGRATVGDFNDFLADPNGPVVGQPIDQVPYLTRLGDVEVGTAILLFDRFPATRIGPGARAALDATVRLRTAQLDHQDQFLDLGTGDRQPDLDVNLTTDFGLGRFGLRLVGGYSLQLPGDQERRIAPPSQPIAPLTSLATVRRDPGDVIRLSARPFIRMATYLSVFGAVDYWNRQSDKYSYGAGQAAIDGVNLSDLSIGTKSDALLISGGVSYSHAGETKRGILKLPIDASFVYQRIIRSQHGILPDISSVRIDLRFYSRLWN